MFDNHAKAVMDILQILFEMLGLILPPGSIFIKRYLNVFMVVEMEISRHTYLQVFILNLFSFQTRHVCLIPENITANLPMIWVKEQLPVSIWKSIRPPKSLPICNLPS